MKTYFAGSDSRLALWCTLALVMLSFAPDIRSTCAQDDRSRWTVQVWQLDSRGNLVRVMKLAPMRLVREDPLFALLRPVLVDELEMSPSQERDLRQLRSRVVRWRQQATTTMLRLVSRDPKVRATVASTVARLAEERTTLAKDLNDILLPFQLRRIEQLRRRRAILVGGWNGDVIRKQLPEVAFDAGELQRAIGTVMKQREALLRDFSRDYRDLMEKTRRAMGTERWVRMVALVGEPAMWATPSYGIMASQLDGVGRRVRPSKDLIRECVASASGFESDMAGVVTLVRHGMADGALLISFFADSRHYGNVRGVPDTSELVTPEEMALRKNQFEEKLRRVLDLYQVGASQVEDILSDLQDALEEYSVWVLKEQLSALDAESRAACVRAFLRRTIGQRGLHWCLVHGDLGRAVGLSDADRARVKELAREELPKWRAASRRQENKLWSLFLSELSLSHRQQCKGKLGESPRKLPGLPMLCLAPAAGRR